MSIKYLYLAICAVIASASEIKNFLSGVEPVSYSEEKSNGTVIKCFWFNSDKISVYDLHYLKPDNDYKNTSLKFEDGQILFNLCDNIPNDHSKCTPDTQVVYKTDEQSCTKRLTDVASKGSEWSLINPDDQRSGIKIKMSPGDDSKRVIFEIKCDNSTDMTEVNTTSSISDDELIFKFSSKYACPQADFYDIYRIIVEKKYIFGSALILIGLFELFLGQKLVTATIFIFSAAIVVLFVFVFFFQFILPGGIDKTVFWFVLAIAIIVGLVLGYFVAKYKDKFFGIIMGALLGYIIGQILYNLALNRININQTALQIIVYVLCIGVCIALSILLFNIVTIFATALIGAYAVIRGISIFAGGFPNETTIADLVKNEETEQLKNLLTWIVYLYLGGWVILFVIGLVVQIKIFAADKKEEKNKETTKEGDDTSAYYKKFGYKK